jgi:hypothetical protein
MLEMSDHRRSQLKWLDAILYMKNRLDTHWLVFLDDDTFIIHSAMCEILQEADYSSNLIIGKSGASCHQLCGGAGFALSRIFIKNLNNQREKVVDAFFTGYFVKKKNKILVDSDVVLSNILKNEMLPGLFVRRNEFRNYPPSIAKKWVRKQNNKSTSAIVLEPIVSFHKIEIPLYLKLYDYFYVNSSKFKDL